MAKVRVDEDGWVSLPPSVRRMLGLQAGSEVEAEVKGGALVLRPVRAGFGEAPEAPAPAPAETKPAAKRGRPRKGTR